MNKRTPWCYSGAWVCNVCARTYQIDQDVYALWLCGPAAERGGSGGLAPLLGPAGRGRVVMS